MIKSINPIIYDYWDSKLPETKKREVKIDAKSDLVSDIVGIRRAGKTYLMFETIKRLLAKTSKRATIYINFENRKLLPLSPDYFNQTISFIHQENLLEKYKKVYLFFDEVQRIEGWEKFIRSIYDEFKGRIKIFVSGSSANLLSREYGKLLSGRHLTAGVFPLSFKEFLEFKNFKLGILSERKIERIKKLLEEYLKFGGFPEIVLQDKQKEKENLLNQLFSDILFRDVLGRTETRKQQVIEEFAYFLSSNIANLLSFNKMANYFKSRGIKVSVPTLENYFYLTKNAFLFFDSQIFSFKVKDQLQYPRKIYCLDNGIVNLVGFRFSENIGRLYENTVAVELLRRFFQKPAVKIFYWKNKKGQEVDFVIKKGLSVKQLIQACFKMEDEETKSREIKALLAAGEELKCKNSLVITADYESEEKIEGRKIKFIPLWKWLLEGMI